MGLQPYRRAGATERFSADFGAIGGWVEFAPERELSVSLQPTAELGETLDQVGRAMASALGDWWVIGSAAASLLGVPDLDVHDVDLLMSEADANLAAALLDGRRVEKPATERFRSAAFFEVASTPLTVEIMVEFSVFGDGVWRKVWPATRRCVVWNGLRFYVPEPAELARICRMFGRPKDLARAAKLERLGRPPHAGG